MHNGCCILGIGSRNLLLTSFNQRLVATALVAVVQSLAAQIAGGEKLRERVAVAGSSEDVWDGQVRAMKPGVSEPSEAEQNQYFPNRNRRSRKGVKNDGGRRCRSGEVSMLRKDGWCGFDKRGKSEKKGCY